MPYPNLGSKQQRAGRQTDQCTQPPTWDACEACVPRQKAAGQPARHSPATSARSPAACVCGVPAPELDMVKLVHGKAIGAGVVALHMHSRGVHSEQAQPAGKTNRLDSRHSWESRATGGQQDLPVCTLPRWQQQRARQKCGRQPPTHLEGTEANKLLIEHLLLLALLDPTILLNCSRAVHFH